MLVSFVPMSNLGQREMFFKTTQFKEIDKLYNNYTYFENNDVLLAKVSPCFENRKAGIAKNLKNGIGFGSSEYIVLRAKDGIPPELIYSFIISCDFNDSGRKIMTGTSGLRRIPTDFVKNYIVPFPDTLTQRDLISQINEIETITQANRKLVEIAQQKINTILNEI